MRITIESIDIGSMQRIGYTKVPSFLVRFTSSMIHGVARFVPSDEDVQAYFGRFCDVEINFERISNFERVFPEELPEAIIALPDSNAFFVRGTITSLVSLGDPVGSALVGISVGEATLTLSTEEIGTTELSLGDRTQFKVYDMSLWDEAI